MVFSIPEHAMDDYCIYNCTIVQGAFLPVIDQGFVRVKDGKFFEVGAGLPPDGSVQFSVDAYRAILVPGFLNIHTHCALSVARGRFHGKSNMVQDFFFPLESKMRPEDMEDLSYPYMMSALASGTTLIADHFYHAEATALAADKLGIRAAIAECLMDLKGAQLAKNARKGFEEFYSKFDWNERIIPIVGPHATDTCSGEFLKELADIAKEKKLPIHMHLSQTKAELDECMHKHGKTPVQHAFDQGVIQKNSVLVHLISASKQDLALIQGEGSRVSQLTDYL
jgi:5-methylthioadenosine/S-adenosylhomocysteine deaminase